MIYVASVTIPDKVPLYTIHQYLYSYFPRHPRDQPRPFVFRHQHGTCTLISRMPPQAPHRIVDIEWGRTYAMEAVVSPEQKKCQGFGKHSKYIPIAGNKARREWFIERCANEGIAIGFCHVFNRERIIFKHGDGNEIRIYPAKINAIGMITDQEKAREFILRGLGHGKSFGMGMLWLPEIMNRSEKLL